jgi:hypothetical protein
MGLTPVAVEGRLLRARAAPGGAGGDHGRPRRPCRHRAGRPHPGPASPRVGYRGPSWTWCLPLGSAAVVRAGAPPAIHETLTRRLLGYAVAWLPEPYREQYQAEWLGELDWLKAQRRPLVGWAVGVLSTSARTRVELRARLARAATRVRALPGSPLARAIGRHRPLGIGVVTATSVFCAAAAGWSGAPKSPSRAQVVWAILAALLAGAVATWQAWPRGPAPQQHDRADEPERPARR